MRTIKRLAHDIEENICEADEKIETAYSLRASNPAMASWYRDMAIAHIGFNSKGHELVSAEISAYKNGQEYIEHPQFADGMKAVWDDKHSELIAKSARVKAMIDSFK